MGKELEKGDPSFIEHKIEWEGWPDALPWLVGYDFGNELLNQEIYDAYGLYNELESKHDSIMDLVDDMLDDGREKG